MLVRMDSIRRESISGTGQVGCCGDKDRGAPLRCSEQGKRMLKLKPVVRRSGGGEERRQMDVSGLV